MEEAPPTFQEPDYPKNAWYAAWDVELKQELLARRICDQNLVMYRRRDGRPVACRTPAGTGCCRCPRASWWTTTWPAAITG